MSSVDNGRAPRSNKRSERSDLEWAIAETVASEVRRLIEQVVVLDELVHGCKSRSMTFVNTTPGASQTAS